MPTAPLFSTSQRLTHRASHHRAAKAPDGRIWLTSDKGLGSITPFLPGDSVPIGLRAFSKATEGEFLTNILFGPDDMIWVGSRFNGLYNGGLNQGDIRHYSEDKFQNTKWVTTPRVISIRSSRSTLGHVSTGYRLNPTDELIQYPLKDEYVEEEKSQQTHEMAPYG